MLTLFILGVYYSLRRRHSKAIGNDHVVVIIGGTSELGRSLGEELARCHRHINIVLVDKQERLGIQIGKSIFLNFRLVRSIEGDASASNVDFVKADISLEHEAAAAWDSIIRKYGHVNTLIINVTREAGRDDDIRSLMETNFHVPVKLTKEFLQQKLLKASLKQGEFQVAVISSIGATIGLDKDMSSCHFALRGFMQSTRACKQLTVTFPRA